MHASRLIAVALAVLLVTAGAAVATPGQPTDHVGANAADDHPPAGHGPDDPGAEAPSAADDDGSENASDDSNGNASDDGDTTAAAAEGERVAVGPPTDMPGPVPDHVSGLHELIGQQLQGALGDRTLGEAISSFLGHGPDVRADGPARAADGSAERADGNANASDGNAAATERGQSTEHAASTSAQPGPAGDLPQRAADHASALHDAIASWLTGGGDASPGDAVSGAASG